VIKIEMDVRTAAAVRESLFRDTKDYTYDLTCCPQRVVDIRNVIVNLDTEIEEELQKAVKAIKESDETTDA
jgi:vacuolar-type H+-ATPase catalytic subunit A/Vma1